MTLQETRKRMQEVVEEAGEAEEAAFEVSADAVIDNAENMN